MSKRLFLKWYFGDSESFHLKSPSSATHGFQGLQAFWTYVKRRGREPMGDFHALALEAVDLTFIYLDHSGMASPICKRGWQIYSIFLHRNERNCFHEYIAVSVIVCKFSYCCGIRFSEKERASS